MPAVSKGIIANRSQHWLYNVSASFRLPTCFLSSRVFVKVSCPDVSGHTEHITIMFTDEMNRTAVRVIAHIPVSMCSMLLLLKFRLLRLLALWKSLALR